MIGDRWDTLNDGGTGLNLRTNCHFRFLENNPYWKLFFSSYLLYVYFASTDWGAIVAKGLFVIDLLIMHFDS